MLLKGFEIQSHQRTAHYLRPIRNGRLTYDAVGQIDPPSPGVGLRYLIFAKKAYLYNAYLVRLHTFFVTAVNHMYCPGVSSHI